jgi:hypothetical protein
MKVEIQYRDVDFLKAMGSTKSMMYLVEIMGRAAFML